MFENISRLNGQLFYNLFNIRRIYRSIFVFKVTKQWSTNESSAGGPRDRKFLCSHTQYRKEVDTHTSYCFAEQITHVIQFRFCWQPLT